MTEGREVLSAETERAIAMLDPDRNFGDRSFTDIVDGIYSGEILIDIIEGARNPLLRLASTGKIIKGSGAHPPPVTSTPHQWAARKFMERALEDFDMAYDQLMDQIAKGNVLAIKIFMEKFVPKAPDIVGQARNDILNALMGRLASGGNGVSFDIIEIDEDGQPIDDDGE